MMLRFRNKNWLASIMVIFLLLTLFVGCGGSRSVDEPSKPKATDAVKDVKPEEKEESKSNTSIKNKPVVSGEKKKIVLIRELADYKKVYDSMLKKLDDHGYNKDNSDIIEIDINNDFSKNEKVVEQVKGLKPDIVLLLADAKGPLKLLKDLDIPVIGQIGTENYMDENRVPTTNITGVTSEAGVVIRNALELLNKKVVNGRKNKNFAVVVTNLYSAVFKKQYFLDYAKENNLTLKYYDTVTNSKEYEAVIDKFGKDVELDTVFIGSIPKVDENEKGVTPDKLIKYYREKCNKPSTTVLDIYNRYGVLCGASVDVIKRGEQSVDMAVEILNGAKIKDVKPQPLSNINIVLNSKAAKDLGIEIPFEIYGAAWKTYTDYEANYLMQNGTKGKD